MFLAIVCHSVYDFLVTPLVSSYSWPLFSLWVTDSSDPLDIFMFFAIVCPSVYNFLVTPLASSYFWPLSALCFTASGDPLDIFMLFAIVCPSVYDFWWPPWHHHIFGHCLSCLQLPVLLWYLPIFGNCLSFGLRFLVSPLGPSSFWSLSVLQIKASGYHLLSSFFLRNEQTD